MPLMSVDVHVVAALDGHRSSFGVHDVGSQSRRTRA